jgi:phosphopantothenoylcysteine decarboxylase/phosphopantothenate--cysteine ligase
MKTILICVTGAVAAASLPSYITTIRKELGVRVVVMLSKNAAKFVTPYSLSLYSGNNVYTDTYDLTDNVLVPHIKHTQDADIVLVMPATANIIAKASCGICDDLISTSIIAATSPVLFIPSMNERMWFSKPVQLNIKKIKEYGHFIVEPERAIEISDSSDSFGGMASLKTIIPLLKKFLTDEIKSV